MGLVSDDKALELGILHEIFQGNNNKSPHEFPWDLHSESFTLKTNHVKKTAHKFLGTNPFFWRILFYFWLLFSGWWLSDGNFSSLYQGGSQWTGRHFGTCQRNLGFALRLHRDSQQVLSWQPRVIPIDFLFCLFLLQSVFLARNFRLLFFALFAWNNPTNWLADDPVKTSLDISQLCASQGNQPGELGWPSGLFYSQASGLGLYCFKAAVLFKNQDILRISPERSIAPLWTGIAFHQKWRQIAQVWSVLNRSLNRRNKGSTERTCGCWREHGYEMHSTGSDYQSGKWFPCPRPCGSHWFAFFCCACGPETWSKLSWLKTSKSQKRNVLLLRLYSFMTARSLSILVAWEMKSITRWDAWLLEASSIVPLIIMTKLHLETLH